MPKVILTPHLIGGWLQEMYEPVERALKSGLEGVTEGRIQGALAVDKIGRVMLLTRLKAEMSEEAYAALMGGLPVEVTGDIEVGWTRDKTVGRLVEGWCYARFATPGMTGVTSKEVLARADEPETINVTEERRVA